jgi:hypothetical protein
LVRLGSGTEDWDVVSHLALADLGVSHDTHNGAHSALLTGARGSPCFVAPEASGSLATSGKPWAPLPADVYSFGMLIAEMMRGELLPSRTPSKADELIVPRPRAVLGTVVDRIDSDSAWDGLRKVFEWCTARDPNLRPKASEVSSRLREAAAIEVASDDASGAPALVSAVTRAVGAREDKGGGGVGQSEGTPQRPPNQAAALPTQQHVVEIEDSALRAFFQEHGLADLLTRFADRLRRFRLDVMLRRSREDLVKIFNGDETVAERVFKALSSAGKTVSETSWTAVKPRGASVDPDSNPKNPGQSQALPQTGQRICDDIQTEVLFRENDLVDVLESYPERLRSFRLDTLLRRSESDLERILQGNTTAASRVFAVITAHSTNQASASVTSVNPSELPAVEIEDSALRAFFQENGLADLLTRFADRLRRFRLDVMLRRSREDLVRIFNGDETAAERVFKVLPAGVVADTPVAKPVMVDPSSNSSSPIAHPVAIVRAVPPMFSAVHSELERLRAQARGLEEDHARLVDLNEPANAQAVHSELGEVQSRIATHLSALETKRQRLLDAIDDLRERAQTDHSLTPKIDEASKVLAGLDFLLSGAEE